MSRLELKLSIFLTTPLKDSRYTPVCESHLLHLNNSFRFVDKTARNTPDATIFFNDSSNCFHHSNLSLRSSESRLTLSFLFDTGVVGIVRLDIGRKLWLPSVCVSHVELLQSWQTLLQGFERLNGQFRAIQVQLL